MNEWTSNGRELACGEGERSGGGGEWWGIKGGGKGDEGTTHIRYGILSSLLLSNIDSKKSQALSSPSERSSPLVRAHPRHVLVVRVELGAMTPRLVKVRRVEVHRAGPCGMHVRPRPPSRALITL